MKTISVINRKGGTGKSTTSVILHAWLHEHGYNALAIDLDAQANLTLNELGEAEHRATILDVLDGKTIAERALAKTDTGFIIPGDRGLANSKPKGAGILKDALQPIKEKFDFCIIDTSPALDALTINALTASDACIIPLVPDRYTGDALERTLDTIDAVKERNPGLFVLGCIVTKYNPRATIHRLATEQLQQTAKDRGIKIYTPYIGTHVALSEAQYFCNVYKYAPKNKGVLAYSEIFTQVIDDINNPPKKKGKKRNGY